MNIFIDDSRSRFQERLNEAEYDRLVALAREKRASAFAQLVQRIARRMSAPSRPRAAARPAAQPE